MACSCKSGSSTKQVTSVKQVVKKTAVSSSPNPQKRTLTKRVIYRKQH